MVEDHPLLPQPPLDAVWNLSGANFVLVLFSALTAMVFLYGIKFWRDSKSPIILMLIAGGLVTTFVEPYLNILSGCWHPIVGQVTAFENMGRKIPYYVFAAYALFFGAQGSLTYLAFRRGISTRGIWLWFGAPVVLAVGMEELMLHFNLYIYYGHQPLILLIKYPLVWAPSNAIGGLLGTTLFVLMGPALRGWKLLLVPILMPVLDAAGYSLVGLPSMIAVNSASISPLVTQIAGVATFALAIIVVWGITLVIANDSPLRNRQASSTDVDGLSGLIQPVYTTRHATK